MDLRGEYRIPADREAVWKALNDPDVLKACIPGCESLEMASPTELAATVVTKIGPVKAKFNGVVTLENLNPPESYTISGEGKGGAAGFAKGGADVHLSAEGAETVLNYEAKAQVGGKLAQLGSRLIDSTAKKLADEFFGNFSETVAAASGGEAPAPSADDDSAPKPGSPAATAADTARRVVEQRAQSPSSARMPLWGWIAAILAVVIIIYFIAT